MNILFQDENIIVAEKPAGLPTETLHEASGEGYRSEWPVAVNRLDQRVSGLILLAKNKPSLVKLNAAFAQRETTKTYRAVVAVAPAGPEGHLVHWLVKDGKTNKTKAFSKETDHGKKAELNYRLVRSSQKYHLLEIELLTGRFHQIRAQLSFIGSPIVGDVKYGYKRTVPDGQHFPAIVQAGFPAPKDQRSIDV